MYKQGHRQTFPFRAKNIDKHRELGMFVEGMIPACPRSLTLLCALHYALLGTPVQMLIRAVIR